MLNTPILFLIFNRPDTTQRVFEAIRSAQPKQLFIAADGPRKSYSDDLQNCAQTKLIVDKIDWECDVKTLFRETNLGCKYAVSSAITWFFSNVTEGIILEDDCVPSMSFFYYCSELLDKYKNDNRVMMISGDNFLMSNEVEFEYSYYFSKYHFIWGWATWKRAWDLYDVELRMWPELFKNHSFLAAQYPNVYENKYWHYILEQTYRGNINTWDYQWAFTMWANHGLSICPKVNLISNIGFDKNATHCSDSVKVSNLPNEEISLPLRHPPFCFQNATLDNIANVNFFHIPTNIFSKYYSRIVSLLRRYSKII
jgi:hypothetical protein